MNTPNQDDQFDHFIKMLAHSIPQQRLITDPLRTLAYGTDASFYRLIPRLVAIVESEIEVINLLQAARRYGIALTFRAAGTSLSGQAASDSVLVKLGRYWNGHSVLDNGERIRLQPGVIGAQANQWLHEFGRKIGPDPASINAAKIGGIAANNASGMCCGTSQNSYQTLDSMRLILADGTVLDTGDETSRQQFLRTQSPLINSITALQKQVRHNEEIGQQIRHRYRIKNTTGYGLNSLLDFDDPIDIIQHLMIGSEGTLGFMAEITYRTVADHEHKASALLLFPTISKTSDAVSRLATTQVAAVELMDRAALRSIENAPGIPDYIATLDEKAAALLVEVRADCPEHLQQQITDIENKLHDFDTLSPLEFSTDTETCQTYWKIRKGLFPAVGAMRAPGTTVIIEDVAFPVQQLADAVLDLQALLRQFDYHEAIIFGHALAGNLHFVFTQDFSTDREVKRYSNFMDAVCELVVGRYNGSLKAEHGTGRNMAPYVEMEWGHDCYKLMLEIKKIFDPTGILNPDVLISDNPHIHIENLKSLPPADPLIDQCMECGFCEPVCPSRDVTLTPRQRIVVQRHISKLQRSGANPDYLRALEESFEYEGIDTCAADGLCATACPVGINTGDLTRQLRHSRNQRYAQRADWIADHFDTATAATRKTLKLANLTHRAVGTSLMRGTTQALRKISGNRIPQWTPNLPKAANQSTLVNQWDPSCPSAPNGKVVYLPSCACRTMGPAQGDSEQRDLYQVTLQLLEKAGYEIVIPAGLDGLCCGMPFESKGMFNAADSKLQELNLALLDASQKGQYPILCDTSPCVFRMSQNIDVRLQLFEPVKFATQFLLPKLHITPTDEPVMLHITCSTRKQGLAEPLQALASELSQNVIVPENISCCGFAGDLGFFVPELNASALEPLQSQVPEGCQEGISTSRTCEVGLSEYSGIHYHSLFYLLDRVSRSISRLQPEPEASE